jgi:uncharacterized membrane protein YgcG
MADAKAKPKTSKSTKKIALYGVLGVGGLALAYWLYTKYEANAATNAAGSSAPADTTPASTPAGTVPATTAPITTLAQWKQAILAYMVSNNIPGGENVAATGLADALSGHCVGPNEFSALNAALGSVGQPPGTAILTIKQCSAKGSGGGQPAGGGTSSTGGGGSTSVPHPKPKKTKVATNRANNAAAAARRRANDLAAAARRRAQNVATAGKPRAPKAKTLPTQVTRATGVR